jgi:hypothetical protein
VIRCLGYLPRTWQGNDLNHIRSQPNHSVKEFFRLYAFAQAKGPGHVLDSRAVDIQLLMSKSHSMAFAIESDCDPDSDADSDLVAGLCVAPDAALFRLTAGDALVIILLRLDRRFGKIRVGG